VLISNYRSFALTGNTKKLSNKKNKKSNQIIFLYGFHCKKCHNTYRGYFHMNFIDLHLHSTYSDGTLTPLLLVKEAKKLGLQAISLNPQNITAIAAQRKR